MVCRPMSVRFRTQSSVEHAHLVFSKAEANVSRCGQIALFNHKGGVSKTTTTFCLLLQHLDLIYSVRMNLATSRSSTDCLPVFNLCPCPFPPGNQFEQSRVGKMPIPKFRTQRFADGVLCGVSGPLLARHFTQVVLANHT